jgi:predicted phage tail protein
MGNYSDNKSFWDKGYASILAIEDYYGDETPYYHTSSDALSTVDMAYYTEFVKASLATFVHLSGCLVTGSAPAVPAAPTGLAATAASTSQINLTWLDSNSAENGFKIERCTGAGCTDFAQIATVAGNVTSYANTGLAASTSYSYRVRAFSAAGESDYSNAASAVTQSVPTLPAAPTNLIATAVSRNQINLTWTDNATNETGFKIERCKGSTCTNFAQIATVGANATSYSSIGLSSNTTYRFRVRAYNATGNSSYSNIAAATTPRR